MPARSDHQAQSPASSAVRRAPFHNIRSCLSVRNSGSTDWFPMDAPCQDADYVRCNTAFCEGRVTPSSLPIKLSDAKHPYAGSTRDVWRCQSLLRTRNCTDDQSSYTASGDYQSARFSAPMCNAAARTSRGNVPGAGCWPTRRLEARMNSKSEPNRNLLTTTWFVLQYLGSMGHYAGASK
jgi:hypothetical protein